MSGTLAHLQLENLPLIAPSSEEGVRRQVWGVLAGLYPRGRTPERRAVQRFPYPQPLYLTPVDDDLLSAANSVAVIGKHISERGLGFYHVQPLPYRRVIASLEVSQGSWAGFLLDVKWTRFTQFGWYDSGGRFLQAVPSPIVGRTP